MQLQWRGQIQVPARGKGCTARSLLLPLAAVALHVLQSSPCVAGKGRQPLASLRDTLCVRFWSSCCSQLICGYQHHLDRALCSPSNSCSARGVPGTIRPLGNRYELCLLWDLFILAGRDWEILSLCSAQNTMHGTVIGQYRKWSMDITELSRNFLSLY